MSGSIIGHNALDRLLDQRPDLWRGDRQRRRDALATGSALLDGALPDGGWPRGRLVELRLERLGLGELELLLPMLATQTRQGRPIALIAPPLVPCPQRLASAGMDLTRLLVVRPGKHAAWVAEQCLKSALFAALVLWLPTRQCDERQFRRLQLAAETGEAPLFVCQASTAPVTTSAMLRLQLHAGGEVEILRGRLGARATRLRPTAGNIVPLRA
ncbi:MAG: translesion DNA synthesis-associated protein ImuA [Wenzhouxiangellaceae bacterium]|nr:translesion DNA synthesis-associated protein ImuA [Wenzhouxiangellaceae bacterium]